MTVYDWFMADLYDGFDAWFIPESSLITPRRASLWAQDTINDVNTGSDGSIRARTGQYGLGQVGHAWLYQSGHAWLYQSGHAWL